MDFNYDDNQRMLFDTVDRFLTDKHDLAKREKLLCVCFAEQGWNWSAGFPLLPNHKTTIKARNLRGQSALLKVRVLESDQTLLVVFDEEHPEFATYRIHNASSEPVLIHQYLAVPHIYETVAAGASVAYAWDDPRITPLLLEVVSARNEEKILLDLDNLGLSTTRTTSASRPLSFPSAICRWTIRAFSLSFLCCCGLAPSAKSFSPSRSRVRPTTRRFTTSSA